MSHQTFKVSIVIDDSVENFYIKHFVDEYQPIFHKFKNLVFQRNPSVNSPILKIYWIDAENDKILLSCEEDFRLYVEQGHGKKIFFSVISAKKQQENDEENEEEMEAEDSNERQKNDRKSKKSARDEEKQRRAAKRLSEKMRCAEEKLRSEEQRQARCPEVYERKSAERLEKAKRRCEKIRQIIGNFDPANLNSNNDVSTNVHATSSAVPSRPASEVDSANLAVLNPTAETIRLLSNAIAGCLQPCNLINKILSDIIGMVPPTGEAFIPSSGATSSSAQASGEASTPPGQTSSPSNDQKQQTEIPRQNSATNTSDLNTPTTSHPSNQEIEALFKEAAKELEKMNDIVNNSKAMESSSGSLGSSMSAITQVERIMQNMTESTFSNATLVNAEQSLEVSDREEREKNSPGVEEDFKIVTPNKSMRSRESSIEVHDVNSMMSDDSRDWTMLDATANDDEEAAQATASTPLIVRDSQAEQVIWDSPVVVPIEDSPSLNPVPNEPTPLNNTSAQFNNDVRTSIQQSIENAARMNEFVKNSVAMAQESLKNVHQQQPPSQAQMLEIFQQMERNHMAQSQMSSVNSQQKQITTASQTKEAPISAEPSTVPPQVPVTRVIPVQVESAIPVKRIPMSELANNAKVPQTPLIPTPVTRTIPVRVETATAPPSTLPPILRTLSATTQANLMAQGNRVSTGTKPKVPQVGPAVVVYDPNPKINAAVHLMMNMGFTNEGGWLTQLLLNVDGDVPKAINFLTPQPKKQ